MKWSVLFRKSESFSSILNQKNHFDQLSSQKDISIDFRVRNLLISIYDRIFETFRLENLELMILRAEEKRTRYVSG